MGKILALIKRKKFLFIIIATVALFVSVRLMLLSNSDQQLTYKVKREPLVDTVQAGGTYVTASQIAVFSPAKGIISELYVDNNSEVEKGDALFHIESIATDQEKASAIADYQAALNNVKIAEQNKLTADASMWTEHKSLLDAREAQRVKNENREDYEDLEEQSLDAAVSQAEKDFKSAEKKYLEADSAIVAAQAKLHAAKLSLAATQSITVNAPASGIIVNLQKNIGDEVTVITSSQQTSSQQVISSRVSETDQPVLVITDPSNPRLTVSISEVYVPRVKVGQKAAVVFDAIKGETFAGIVESVDTVGTDRGGIVTYNARIVLNANTYQLKPNMTAIATIETFRKNGVLAVPGSAIVDLNNKQYVRIADDENRLIEVSTGIKGMTKTEITKGINEGTTIVASVIE